MTASSNFSAHRRPTTRSDVKARGKILDPTMTIMVMMMMVSPRLPYKVEPNRRVPKRQIEPAELSSSGRNNNNS